DAAQVCFIELVDFDPDMAKDAGKKKTRRSRRGGAAKTESAPAAEAPAAEAAPAAEEAPAEEAKAE
ncbi:MAG: 50S ribosomal protein L17, partial [Prevotella sp.]|nr:50S ribosomal protein L17 [Prevotella sp.]